MTYKGRIQIGDIVVRRKRDLLDQKLADRDGEYGIVVHRSMEGSPRHPCVHVSWSKRLSPVSISESYVEVVCNKEI